MRPSMTNPVSRPCAAGRTLERHPPLARAPRLAGLRRRRGGAGRVIPTQGPTTPTTGSASPARPNRSSTTPASTAPTPRTSSSPPEGGQLDAAEAEAAAIDVRREMADVDGVDEVAEPEWSPDRSALLDRRPARRDQESRSALRAAITAVQREHPTCEMREAGDVSLDEAINERVGRGPRRGRGAQPAGHPRRSC